MCVLGHYIKLNPRPQDHQPGMLPIDHCVTEEGAVLPVYLLLFKALFMLTEYEECFMFFPPLLVAEKFLSLESFTILENTFYVLSPENKNMDEKQKSLEASLENQKEVDEDHRTVEVHGVNSSEVADLLASFMGNKRKGGGLVESESLDKNNGILTLKFQDKRSKKQLLDTGNALVSYYANI